jgi:hypothetical protein
MAEDRDSVGQLHRGKHDIWIARSRAGAAESTEPDLLCLGKRLLGVWVE